MNLRNSRAEWQNDYFGRHVQLVPAEYATGYQYRGPLADPGRVQRAIPADGTVYDSSLYNVPTPQVDLRFGKPHKWKKAVTRTRRKRPKRLRTTDIIA